MRNPDAAAVDSLTMMNSSGGDDDDDRTSDATSSSRALVEGVGRRVLAQLKSESGEAAGAPFDLPINVTVQQLQLICNAILKKEEDDPKDKLYSFFVGDEEIRGSLEATLKAAAAAAAQAGSASGGRTAPEVDTEKVLEIVYQPQAVFRVRAVTRCTSSLPGHAEAVIAVQFSPDGRHLASGSGDTTVRFWDVNTETPHFKCQGHRHWVLCISWSPDGCKLASGCKNGQIMIWNPLDGKEMCSPLNGHKQWITWISWEPLHRNSECRRLCSSSKDGSIRIWDVVLGTTLFCLSGHRQKVTCVRWGGTGLLYSASQDRTICVWRADDGVLCRTLEGHAHWVNILALSTDYVIRTGAFDPSKASFVDADVKQTRKELQEKALRRYEAAKGADPERLVSGSDDFTMFLWRPEVDKKPAARMTGHQQLVNDVRFSPDGRLLASASFDKSVKLWEGRSGKFLASLRGHVQAVYQLCWSADGRLLVSGSADSTLKLWDVQNRKLAIDLPGHADEVYATDWSPDGQRVASGGKDKILKIWRQ